MKQRSVVKTHRGLSVEPMTVSLGEHSLQSHLFVESEPLHYIVNLMASVVVGNCVLLGSLGHWAIMFNRPKSEAYWCDRS